MDNEQHFIEGFNRGFLLAKYEPILLIKVLQNLRATNEYVKGLFFGKEEFEMEITRNRYKDFNWFRNQSMQRGNELDLDL